MIIESRSTKLECLKISKFSASITYGVHCGLLRDFYFGCFIIINITFNLFRSLRLRVNLEIFFLKTKVVSLVEQNSSPMKKTRKFYYSSCNLILDVL